MARGFQEGKEGKSYAIQTIVRPGAKRSTPLKEIQKQLIELSMFATRHQEYDFLMTPVGSGLAGWTDEEMREVWIRVVSLMPSNVTVPNNLYVKTNFLHT